jgi:rhamnose transport system permease protein
MENSDRIVVFRMGRVAGTFEAAATISDAVAAAALGQSSVDSARPLASTPRPRRRFPWLRHSELPLGIAVLLLVIGLALEEPAFLTADNLGGLLASTAVLAILALGAGAVIMAGAIDISLGSLLALSAGVAGLVLKLDYGPAVTIPAAVIAALGVGTLGGLLNAGLALGGRIHPIVVTLGTLTIFRGLLVWLTGGDTITDLPQSFVTWSSARVLGVNGSVAVGVLAAAAVHLWLVHFRSGRFVLAFGSSPTAAALAGISRARAWLTAFGVGGFLTALSGVVELSQTGAVQSGVGVGYELRAIAAAVIGGVSIAGGRGSVLGVCLGALALSLISNVLVLWEISRYHYSLVTGALLLAAVLVDLAWRRLEK